MGARFSAPVQTGPGAHPAPCTMGTRSFPGAKSGRGVTLTPHPLLVPWTRKGRALPLLPLWAVRPVQSLSACAMVHFFYMKKQATGLTSLKFFFTFVGPCIVIYFYSKTNQMHNISNLFYFGNSTLRDGRGM